MGYWEKLVAAAEEDAGAGDGEVGRGVGTGRTSLYHVTLWHSAEHSADTFDEVHVCVHAQL